MFWGAASETAVRARRRISLRPAPKRCPTLRSQLLGVQTPIRAADLGEHAVGAASIKEFLNGDNTHGGWTMSLKTQEGAGADTWTWWEGFAPDHQASEFGIAVSSCERCHGDAKDRDRSPVDMVP